MIRKRNINEGQQKMLICTFLIYRVLLGQIFLKPTENISGQLGENVVRNFKVLASVLYWICESVIGEMLNDAKTGQTGEIRGQVYSEIEIKEAMREEWVGKMKGLFTEWMAKAFDLMQKADSAKS